MIHEYKMSVIKIGNNIESMSVCVFFKIILGNKILSIADVFTHTYTHTHTHTPLVLLIFSLSLMLHSHVEFSSRL